MMNRLVSALAALLLSVGCSTTSTTSPATNTDGGGGGGGADGGGGGKTLPATDLTCNEIFDCAASCPDNDDPCGDACLARGSTEGRAAATKLATCYQSNACADGECLKAKCGTELTACVTQERAGKPIAGTAPSGATPPALVGKWHHFYAPTNHVHDFTFNADGTAAEYITTSSVGIGSCPTHGIGDSTGTVVFTDTTMTYYATAGTSAWSTCGKETIKPITPSSREYAWSMKPTGELVLIDRGIPSCVENPSSCEDTYTKN